MTFVSGVKEKVGIYFDIPIARIITTPGKP
jgi:hypothetical protein